MAFIASLVSLAMYVIVSLATCREPFDMDRLLHRGRYADDAAAVPAAPVVRSRLHRLVGITAECTRGDRVIYYLKVIWTAFWVVTFVIGTIWSGLFGISDQHWSQWWLFTVVIGAVVGAITIVWFLWGGFRDLGELLGVLGSAKRDASDDGSVATGDEERAAASVAVK
jgi:SSS family solute:Na+ symporter